MEELLKKVNDYLNDLEENEDKLNGDMDLLIDYFHDANELLVELTSKVITYGKTISTIFGHYSKIE